jgi:hypothetical protein
MRHLTMIMIAVLITLSALISTYAQTPDKITADISEQKLVLYAQPDEKSVVVCSLDQWHRLIPIYRQGDWIKVGKQDDGQVGWVNVKQYHNFMKSWFHPHIKSVIITIDEQSDEKGKTEIIAYKNGKKLEEKEAKQLSKHFQKNQTEMKKRLSRMQKEMDKMFDSTWEMWDMDAFDNLMRAKMHTFHRMLFSSPIMIMITQPDEK